MGLKQQGVDAATARRIIPFNRTTVGLKRMCGLVSDNARQGPFNRTTVGLKRSGGAGAERADFDF